VTRQDPPRRTREVRLQLLAGFDPQGQPVLEKLEAWGLEVEHCYELMLTPLFVRNLAAGDIFRVTPDSKGTFQVVRRSGNLSIRVFSRNALEGIERELTPEVEKLGGALDRASERALAYRLHVNVGFAAVEGLFDRIAEAHAGSAWYYGNVYDPADGTPLNWWHACLNQT